MNAKFAKFLRPVMSQKVFLFLAAILVKNILRITSMNSPINSPVNSDSAVVSPSNAFFLILLGAGRIRDLFSFLSTRHINPPSLPLKDVSSVCQLISFVPSSLFLHRWTSSMSWTFVFLNCPIFSSPSPHLLKYHRSRIFLVLRLHSLACFPFSLTKRTAILLS